MPDVAPVEGSELPTDRFVEGPDEPTQVVYELSTPDGTEQLTVAWEGDRFVLIRSDGQILRLANGTVVFCSASPEGDICWDFEDRGPPFLRGIAADLLAVYGLVDLIPASARELDDQTIAGRDATCVAFSPPGAATPASPSSSGTTFCYDRETEVGLRLDVSAGDTTQTLVATSVGAPDDGIFNPPAQVLPYPEDGAPPEFPTP
ncbi:MAG: hypothetical protein R3343_02460 [Nitriliruptorales bacterium]|nr:hypothetical protein [Nitriliruptorales bacterium]